MDDLRFYVPFNSSSVITGRYVGDNKRLCQMEPRLRDRKRGSIAHSLSVSPTHRPYMTEKQSVPIHLNRKSGSVLIN